ncbi:rod shape-determining protein MreC [Pacificimonas flava]|uniref:Cell shape-determining protein MreC n=1 Tax=Pacificimonas flava TaxID=1234595 RepID=M2S9M7_9SPHN|nr:rod shape-determining protein MreC [Pacificimonas flava]EMD82090.1 Rod shape-determining protein MreC [Pacificimonas flava]MBB5280930.1 rod shape-determining protein MreC [Pacificimonas flava]
MAWPPRRKTSRTTKREQTQALLGRGVLIVVLLIAAMLLILSRYAPARTDDLRGASADAVAPFWRLLQVPITALSNASDNIGNYFDAVNRVKRLEGREAVYRARRVQFEEAVRENRELRALMGVVEPDRARVGTFAISGASSGVFSSEALIGGGWRHGVRTGQPVRTPQGLIGRTVEVGHNAARVMLVTDISSRIPVRVVRTGLPALVVGANQPLLQVDLTGPTSNQVEIGDRLITSGDGGLFSPGIPVATIVRAEENNTPLARPAALPALTQYVLVEEPWGTNFEAVTEQQEPEASLPMESVPTP